MHRFRVDLQGPPMTVAIVGNGAPIGNRNVGSGQGEIGMTMTTVPGLSTALPPPDQARSTKPNHQGLCRVVGVSHLASRVLEDASRGFVSNQRRRDVSQSA